MQEAFVGGSRDLAGAGVVQVGHVVRFLGSRGLALRVGCAAGADAAFLKGAVAQGVPVRLFCAGGAGGVSWPRASLSWSALSPLSLSPLVSPVFFAGGRPPVPVRARLAQRTRAAVAGATLGVLVLSRPDGPGSALAVRSLLAAGAPVFAVCVGFSPLRLPFAVRLGFPPFPLVGGAEFAQIVSEKES